ncbi:MAG: tetratricopeptide repeat protein [Campylobacterales bacterium]|nr:tetratricopeptide repeat protein [Campylobacterales bacterium]
MAQEEEIIIIDEADPSAPKSEISDAPSDEEVFKRKKKLLLLIGGALIALLLIIVIVLLIFRLTSKSAATTQDIETLGEEFTQKAPQELPASQLEKMITRANFLYSNGNQIEALKLYEKIAVYSEAISQYNLGVAQLKEGEYTKALYNFKQAISKGEHRCVSALNAAVCSLYLNDHQNFRYYIDMAHAFLPYESGSPLYSYYFALINYYKEHYLEALSALLHPSSQEYPNERSNLQAKIDTLFGNYHQAIASLEPMKSEQNALMLGSLYANIGDLTLAKEHLLQAVQEEPDNLSAALFLTYVYLKSGLHDDAGKLLRSLGERFGEALYTQYPIQTYLHQDKFEPDRVQNAFRAQMKRSRVIHYQQIFYFAPYKVFNAEQTISYIRKGNANIYIDDISSAKEYLQKSTQTSSINYGIAQGIQKALLFRLDEANSIFLALHEQNPRHSILNYNLALSFAQKGDLVNAHNYFLKSYYLDANNYMAGIFAIMSAELINQVNPKLVSIIKENLSHEEDSEEFELYRALFNFSQNNFVATLPWLEKQYKERPLYLVLNHLIAREVGRDTAALQAAEKLKNRQNRDILPHLIYANAKYDLLATKDYAKALLSYLQEQSLSMEDLEFGPYLTRHLYTQAALMTGTIHPLRVMLEKDLETTTQNPTSLIQALAMVSLYDQQFENAYLLYNQLIDTYKVLDSQTLFLGAIASIGSDHPANAIALLELAKLKNPNNKESRFVLGMLYLQSKNAEGAAIQFQHIGNSGFISDFINFEIDTKKMLLNRPGT